MSLTIRRENLPVRCEICHQTDLFDPETGNCLRCVSATVGAALLRQDEAVVNGTKPDVSEEYRKNQRKMLQLEILDFGLFLASEVLFIFNIKFFVNWIGPFAILLSGFPMLLFTFVLIILSLWFGRCPNCRCLGPGFHGSTSPANTCRKCGATLIRQ